MAYKQTTSDVKIHLKEIMKDRSMTFKELAEKLGVTPVTISYIANNKSTPSLDMVYRMAKVLNVKLSTLLGEEPLKVVDSSGEFAAFVRCRGKHFVADNVEEFEKIVEEVRTIAK